jgi:hypothetical protein
VAQPIMPLKSPQTRWRWGWHVMVLAFVASLLTSAYAGGKAGFVVLLVLLLANGAAAEAGRAPRG